MHHVRPDTDSVKGKAKKIDYMFPIIYEKCKCYIRKNVLYFYFLVAKRVNAENGNKISKNIIKDIFCL